MKKTITLRFSKDDLLEMITAEAGENHEFDPKNIQFLDKRGAKIKNFAVLITDVTEKTDQGDQAEETEEKKED